MRIAIVDDSPMAVEVIRRTLRQAEHQIAWVAGNGLEAVRQCAADRPDLVLMDLLMPVMNGVEATRQIMASTPCAILVVTSSVGANTPLVFDAMGHGALDAVDTPVAHGEAPAQGPGAALLAKVATIGRLIGKSAVGEQTARPAPVHRARPVEVPPLAVLGASTGGPRALATILGMLAGAPGCALVVVQHVDPQFAGGMATWLSRQCGLTVAVAEEGARPAAGTVLVAGRDGHLIVTESLDLAYTPEPEDLHYRPSVDVFFDSVARHWPEPGYAALLTGMGRDGARGLAELKRAGWHTVAQDRQTSVVYGMPAAAAELGAALQVLPLSQIGLQLAARMAERRVGVRG